MDATGDKDLGLLCPDNSWIPWQQLGSAQLFGNGRHVLTDQTDSEVQFTLSAGSDEKHLQLSSMGANRAFQPMILCVLHTAAKTTIAMYAQSFFTSLALLCSPCLQHLW